MADTIFEVGVDDYLLGRRHDADRANIGRMTTCLSRIEQFARINKLESVALNQWGNRPLFFDQPTFRRKR